MVQAEEKSPKKKVSIGEIKIKLMLEFMSGWVHQKGDSEEEGKLMAFALKRIKALIVMSQIYNFKLSDLKNIFL